MTPKLSQTDRLLAMLRAGSVTTTELRHAGLGNPSERVRELEARGHVIRHRDEVHQRGHRQTRYDLAETVEEPPMYTHEHGQEERGPVVLAFSIEDPAARVALAAAFDYSDRIAAERRAA